MLIHTRNFFFTEYVTSCDVKCMCTYIILFIFLLFHFIYLFIFVSLGPQPQHMEVPRLGAKSELQLLACAPATATPDLSHVCNPHHSSWQRWILNLLSEARVWTCILMVANQIRFRWAMAGTPTSAFQYLHNMWICRNLVKVLLTTFPFFSKYFLLLTNTMDYCVVCICRWVLLQVWVPIPLLWNLSILEFPRMSGRDSPKADVINGRWMNDWNPEKSLPLPSNLFSFLRPQWKVCWCFRHQGKGPG